MTDLEYLELTVALMRTYGVAVRDTYDASINYDDFYANGNRYDGPRQFKIEWEDIPGHAHIKFNKLYDAKPFLSVAYDAATLVMPLRFQGKQREDAIVHECVHFLQSNTMEEDKRYIQFAGNNFVEYFGQRVELEAHLIQVAYINDAYPERFAHHMGEAERQSVSMMLACAKVGVINDTALNILLLCKQRELI